MHKEKIDFRQSRDFGETFNVSVQFLRQNFKHLFSSLLAIAGPFVFLSAITGAMYQSSSLSLMSASNSSLMSDPLAAYGLWFFLFILANVLSSLVLIGTTFSYMICYREKGPDNFTVADVATMLKNSFGKIFLSFLLMLLIVVVSIAIIALLIGLVAMVAPVLGVIFGILLIFGMLIVMPPLIWQFTSMYLVVISENKGPVESLKRTTQVMRGEYWWTWLVILCATLGVGVASFIFTAPQMIYQMILMFTNIKEGAGEVSIPFIIVATVCTFLSTFVYSCMYIIAGFHYFSLAEKKDGTGLLDRINEIGSQQ